MKLGELINEALNLMESQEIGTQLEVVISTSMDGSNLEKIYAETNSKTGQTYIVLEGEH